MDNNNTESNSRQLGAAFLVVGWIAFIALISMLIHHIYFSTQKPTISETDAGKQITIFSDYDSHFRIKGEINGIAVTFLIDTGATSVAIPKDIADKANLERRATIQAETAAGTTTGYFTRIDDLSFGDVNLHNISAVVIPEFDSDQVLLGMNVLGKFSIKQTRDKLILTVPNNN